MVIVHARFSSYGDTFITMFHMPLFFFFSGYCFKEKYLKDVREFSIKRIKGIYTPYVKWGLFFLAFHNLFYYLNLYNSVYGYHGNVSYEYETKDFLIHAIRIMTSLSSHEQLLGGYWFLHTLFFASFIFYATLKYFKPVLGGGILLILCIVSLIYGVKIPYFSIGARELLAAFFMIAGYFYKKSNLKYEDTYYVIPMSLFLLIIGSLFWPCGMLSLSWQKVIPYSVTALFGIIMVFSISKLIIHTHFFNSFFVYIGERTLEILTWHMLSFKVISLLIIWYYSLRIEKLAEFPVITEYAISGYWLLYFIAGLCLPLLTISIIDTLKIRLLK